MNQLSFSWKSPWQVGHIRVRSLCEALSPCRIRTATHVCAVHDETLRSSIPSTWLWNTSHRTVFSTMVRPYSSSATCCGALDHHSWVTRQAPLLRQHLAKTSLGYDRKTGFVFLEMRLDNALESTFSCFARVCVDMLVCVVCPWQLFGTALLDGPNTGKPSHGQTDNFPVPWPTRTRLRVTFPLSFRSPL